jgi:hypothetical protein
MGDGINTNSWLTGSVSEDMIISKVKHVATTTKILYGIYDNLYIYI